MRNDFISVKLIYHLVIFAYLLIRDGLLYAKVQKIITYAIILTILFDYFTANVYLLIFSLQKKHMETR